MQHYTLKAPGQIELSGQDEKSNPTLYTLTVDVEKFMRFSEKMRSIGFPQHKAGALESFKFGRADEEALEVALSVFGGVTRAENVLHVNRGRIRSWCHGIHECVYGWLGSETYEGQDGNELLRGAVVTDSEMRLTQEVGTQFKVLFTIGVGKKVSRYLRATGLEETAPLQLFNGPLSFETMRALLVFGTQDSESVKGLDTNSVDAFMNENRANLFGWWLVMREVVNRYHKEASSAPLG